MILSKDRIFFVNVLYFLVNEWVWYIIFVMFYFTIQLFLMLEIKQSNHFLRLFTKYKFWKLQNRIKYQYNCHLKQTVAEAKLKVFFFFQGIRKCRNAGNSKKRNNWSAGFNKRFCSKSAASLKKHKTTESCYKGWQFTCFCWYWYPLTRTNCC